jgi:phosphoribosyl 1,2-cyclic phosphate phosphodiesterase
MRVEILGSGGAVTIPRPGCGCRVCVEAREKGAPYSRTGPSVFVHGPDVLIDTPEESKQQLNRSQVTRIAAGLYSHWHPDHTAGRRVWEARNFDFRSWPPRYETTPVYVPERVWADFEQHYGLADQFRFLERQGTVRIELLAEHATFELDGTQVTSIPLDAENAHAFLFSGGGKRVLIAMDETHRWSPPADLGPIDLAVLPIGVFEHHPYSGERLIPEEFCKPPVRKARYEMTLELVRSLAPRRTVLTHVEEMDRLSHDELRRLGAADGWEPAYDGLIVDLDSDELRSRGTCLGHDA